MMISTYYRLWSDLRYIANFVFCINYDYVLDENGFHISKTQYQSSPSITFSQGDFMVLLFPTSVMLKAASVLVYFILFWPIDVSNLSK